MSGLLRLQVGEDRDYSRDDLDDAPENYEQCGSPRVGDVAREHLRYLAPWVETAVVCVALARRVQSEPQPYRSSEREDQPEEGCDERGNLHETEHMGQRERGGHDERH